MTLGKRATLALALAWGSSASDAQDSTTADAQGSPDTDAQDAPVQDAPTDAAIDALTCTQPLTACNGACVDVQTDNGNCGACGAACAGTCLAGKCAVTETLASPVREAEILAVGPTGVYFSSGGSSWLNYTDATLLGVHLDGGTVATLGAAEGVFGVALDSTNVYWTADQGIVAKTPIAGGSTVTLASGVSSPGFVAVQGSNVYWTTTGTSAGSHLDGAVLTVPVAGGGVTTIASGQHWSGGLATDATNVYWACSGTGPTHYTDGTIMKAPLAGGAPTTMASGRNASWALAVDANNVYWVDNGTGANHYQDGTVLQMPLAGGSVTTLASAQHQPYGITVDSSSVYWVNQGTFYCPSDGGTCAYNNDGSVMSVPIGGGTPTALATAVSIPQAIVVAASGIYWTTFGTYEAAYRDGALTRMTIR
jgi:hypothetical protein